MSKSTQHEYAKRVEMARLLIVMGETPENICRNMSAGLKVTERQARRYIADAKAEIQRELEPAKPYLLAEHVSIRRNLRKRAIDAGDLRAALAAMKDEAELLDLYPAKKTENTGANGEPMKMVIEVIRRDDANGN